MSQEVSKRVSKWVIPPIYHYTPFIRGYNPDTSYLSCGFPTSYWTELHEWCGWGGACQRIPKKPCPPSNKKGERVVELGFCGIFRSVHGEHVLSIVILIGAATTSERCWKKNDTNAGRISVIFVVACALGHRTGKDGIPPRGENRLLNP